MTLWNPLRLPAWMVFRATSRTYLRLSRRRYRYVFILGHMRSGSTLLAHILASHADFAGAGESHISYETAADLPKLVLRTGELLHRPILRETYIVDQINHDYVSDAVLASGQLYRCVILIREPKATLKSMMSLFKCDEREALNVYARRLASLTRYGRLLKGRAILATYDDLVHRTDETLSALTHFFALESVLASDYTTHRMTARIPGIGDPSNNIKSGRVIRTPAHDRIGLSEETINAGTSAFQICRKQLNSVIAQAIVDGMFHSNQCQGSSSTVEPGNVTPH